VPIGNGTLGRTGTSMKLSVIIPVYNAEDYIVENLVTLENYLKKHFDDFEIIVVDDHSTDQSSHRIKNERRISHFRLFTLAENKGKFAAIKHGILEAKGSCCVFTDADLPYHLEAIPYIEHIINERNIHLAIADRSLPESDYKETVPLHRRVFNIICRNFIRIFIISGIFDSQAGLKGLRSDVAKAIFPLMREDRFSGDIELLYIALKYNLEIKRIPVCIQRTSPSSVHITRESIRAFKRILQLPIDWRQGRYSSASLAKISNQKYW
jgi:dolichyl-phosphate beta-glucosyltransferase